jgi:hypothetical protein
MMADVRVLKPMRLKLTGYVACVGHEKFRKPQRRRPIERPVCRWEDDIKINFR